MFTVVMEKVTQIGLLITSGTIYLLNQMDVSIIEKAFDQLFSLGLLIIAIVLIYREWKGEKRYNKERDERLEELIENNTEALRDFKREIRNIHDRIDENQRRINAQKDEQRN